MGSFSFIVSDCVRSFWANRMAVRSAARSGRPQSLRADRLPKLRHPRDTRLNIRNRFASTASIVAAACGILASPVALASHHFESPLAKAHPQFDLTDLFVFGSEAKGYTTFMMDVNPTTGSDGTAKFGENGLYTFNIAEDQAVSGKGMILTAHLKGGKFVFGMSKDGVNQAVGVKGTPFGEAPVGSAQTFANGVRVWTGAARDPFVGNAGGLEKLRAGLTSGKLDMEGFESGENRFAKLNSSVIVVEVPNAMLPKSVYVYATTAFYNVDKWEQVNRMANPLMTHLFMYSHELEKYEHVGHGPDIDPGRRYAISAVVLRALTLDPQSTVKDKVAYADKLAAELLPDVIAYRPGTAASFAFGNINGRKPTDDAMDVELSRFLGRPVTDHANAFDHHPVAFPYVVKLGSAN